MNCTSDQPEICLPKLLETSHSLEVQTAFDRRSRVPPPAACPTPCCRLPSASWAGGTVCFASCSGHSLQCFKLEGGFYIETLRSGVTVVSHFASSGCRRPITNSFRAEHLFNESLLLEDWLDQPNQTEDCYWWSVVSAQDLLRLWDLNLCFSLRAGMCAEDRIFCPIPPSCLSTCVIVSHFVTFCLT